MEIRERNRQYSSNVNVQLCGTCSRSCNIYWLVYQPWYIKLFFVLFPDFAKTDLRACVIKKFPGVRPWLPMHSKDGFSIKRGRRGSRGREKGKRKVGDGKGRDKGSRPRSFLTNRTLAWTAGVSRSFKW
jgi:hypothetical protein